MMLRDLKHLTPGELFTISILILIVCLIMNILLWGWLVGIGLSVACWCLGVCWVNWTEEDE